MKRKKRVKKRSLAIIEKAFRGSLEEQYGDIVWLSDIMNSMGADHNLLLCGDTTLFAVKGQSQITLSFGENAQIQLSNHESSIKNLISKGAEIFIMKEDMKKFFNEDDLIEGIKIVNGFVDVIEKHDHVWFW